MTSVPLTGYTPPWRAEPPWKKGTCPESATLEGSQAASADCLGALVSGPDCQVLPVQTSDVEGSAPSHESGS